MEETQIKIGYVVVIVKLGKTPYMQSVYVENASKDLFGKILNVKITDAFLNSVTGQILI
jgi:tRNA-2-methylthio-N6-dimethylallyladenosine synthase